MKGVGLETELQQRERFLTPEERLLLSAIRGGADFL